MNNTIGVAVIGPGGVGSAFLDQISNSNCRNIKVYGIINSSRMILSHNGLDLLNWRDLLKHSAIESDMTQFVFNMIKYSKISKMIMVDCTCSEKIANLYIDWVRNGLNIVTPNKKAFSGDLNKYKDLLREASDNNCRILHESTVGAGLPILSTLKNLVNTGDNIIKIEGILSGTLSYIFNTFSKKGANSFSHIVNEAKNYGYTEPDPRDDLNGIDFARKLVILGRLCGLEVNLEDVIIEGLLSKELYDYDLNSFMSILPKNDIRFERLKNRAEESETVLRYIGVIDMISKKVSIELKEVNNKHPFASLEGSDNIISFTTERYPRSLVIQGAGAGANVTAFGIFVDILSFKL